MQLDEKKIIRARDVLERGGITTIDGMATAQEGAAMMRSEKKRCLLVQKRHADDAWGIVVVQDFIKGVLVADRSTNSEL